MGIAGIPSGETIANTVFVLVAIAIAVLALRDVGVTSMFKKRDKHRGSGGTHVHRLIEQHFHPQKTESLIVNERVFPLRMRADLQRVLDTMLAPNERNDRFLAVYSQHHYGAIGFEGLLLCGHYPAVVAPPKYDEIDVGEDTPVRCLKNGLWLMEDDGSRYAVFVEHAKNEYGETAGIKIHIATTGSQADNSIVQRLFEQLEESVRQAHSYRGKILSLAVSEHYSGRSSGITVHQLRSVSREQVILPAKTLELLDRNVIRFAQQRNSLKQLGRSTKKGLLFYGPPGTGKTHTIHYLAGALPEHTTFLITAEQVGLLPEYMTLARLLQPSVVVIEDVDLIGRDREEMDSPCEEVMLNKLLNEMDGLTEDAEIFFLLTTNRPEVLETALTARPGRIDQAIEFPLPDQNGREKLVELYSNGVELEDGVLAAIVRRTDNVSAAFIKELMRRSVQFLIERDGDGRVSLVDVDGALDEMLFAGGSLNVKLLGGRLGDASQDGP
jgi:AAA+ superfamily predicted ATPase